MGDEITKGIDMKTRETQQPIRKAMERIEQVSDRIQLGRSWIWAAVKRGEFPAPQRLSPRCTRWDSSLVDRWIDDRLKKAGTE